MKRIYSPIYLAPKDAPKDEPKYECPICGKKLTTGPILRKHLQLYIGVTQEIIDKAETNIQNVRKENRAASLAKRLAKKKSNPPNPPKPRRKKKDK